MTRRFAPALFAVLLFAAPAAAQPKTMPPANPAPVPDLSLPAKVTGQVGDFIPVTAETKAKAVLFLALDETAVKVFPVPLADPRQTVVIAKRPGTYKIAAGACVDGRLVREFTVVEAVGDDPNPPGPNPPPAPDDPLAASLRAAWAKEAAADRAKAPQLAAMFRLSATSTAQRADLKTAKDLYDVLHAARVTLVGDALPNVRAAITAELDRTLPTSASAPLDPATRDLCAKTFARVAAALEGLK